MYSKEVVVRCESGLHNKQATYFVQKANEYESSIWLESGHYVPGYRLRFHGDPQCRWFRRRDCGGRTGSPAPAGRLLIAYNICRLFF